MLDKPMYRRLVLGTIENEKPLIHFQRAPDQISPVPFAEPMAFTPGYHSPFYSENHRAFHRAVRTFTTEIIRPEANAREDDGKKISQAVVDKMAYASPFFFARVNTKDRSVRLAGCTCDSVQESICEMSLSLVAW